MPLLVGLAILLLGSTVDADEPNYGFVWVRTILGPCCGDVGADPTVDTDGGVLVAGKRGGLDLDRDGSADIQSFGSPDPLSDIETASACHQLGDVYVASCQLED